MKIGIGNDHAGVQLKQQITAHLRERGYEVVNFGTDTTESVDYPIPAEKVARAVAEGSVDLGIGICGTGVGFGLAANKVRGIRCAMVSEPFSARKARQHNNCNMISLGARVIGPEMALMIVDAFLDAQFEGGRHARRVQEIMDIEKKRK